jgi:hypothetical protein
VGSPLLGFTLFGVYLGLLVWGGLWLRTPALRALFPVVNEVERLHARRSKRRH